jgi:hypothetical protein
VTLKCLFPIILKVIVLAAFISTTRKIMRGGDFTELYDHMAFNDVPEMTRVFKKKRNFNSCV